MNRGFGFILSVPILFIAILLMLLVHNVQQEQMQLEEYVLKFAIDYSTDAAVEEMLSMSHLGQDYAIRGVQMLTPRWRLQPLSISCA